MWLLEQQHPLNRLIDDFAVPIIESNTSNINANFDRKNSKLISIKGREFNDSISINIDCDEAILYVNPFYDFPDEHVNILQDMYDAYIVENEAKWRSTKQTIIKYSQNSAIS